MFLDAEDGSRNVFANGNIIRNLCSLLLEPLKGDNTYWDTEALKPSLNCQSHDFIGTARTCTGNASPRFPKIIS